MRRRDVMRVAGTFGLLAIVASGCGIERVSVATDGTRANGTESYAHPAISADGRFVVFESNATNLLSGDTNGVKDVFAREATSASALGRRPVTERVSLASDGTQANGDSSWPSTSADGRYVAFESTASNLVAGDTNGVSDVFVRDRQTNTTARVSVADDGSELVPGTMRAGSHRPAISADGRYVAFVSDTPHLGGAGKAPELEELYLRDLVAERTVHLAALGSWEGGDHAHVPDRAAISADGTVVAYVTGDGIAILDRSTGHVDQVSATGETFSGPSVSAEGRLVSYAHDRYDYFTVEVLDRLSGTTSQIAALSPTGSTVLSGDGRYVAFSAKARHVTYGTGAHEYSVWEPTDQPEIYRLDRQSGKVTWITAHLDNAANRLATSQAPAIDGDGKKVAFTSTLYNFGSGEANPISDVFTWTEKQ